MLIARFIVSTLSAGLMFLGADRAFADIYPNKPIRMVTSNPGGGSDFTARLIAQGISISLGQNAIVENKSGGVIPGATVSKASPDGHTLLVSASILWIASLMQKTPYDPVRDFSPITLATSSPNILVVNPSLPVTSVRDLIALAKAKPGDLNYASPGAGGAPHLAAELFKAMAAVNIVQISFKGTGAALNGLIGGDVHIMFSDAGSVAPQVKSGRLRALAVTSLLSSRLAPGLPTLAASGLPGFESSQKIAVFVPVKTPMPIINRLNQEIVRVLSDADVKEKFFNAGVEVVGSSPEQLTVAMTSDMARMGKVIRDAGIKGE